MKPDFFFRHFRDYFNEKRAFPRSRQASDEEDSARIAAASVSAPLSMLIIPSIKEVRTFKLCIRGKLPLFKIVYL